MSDQDFFFDEEEEARPAKKEPAKPASKSVSTKRPAAASSGGGAFMAQSVTMSIASLMAVIALLVGVIIGILLPLERQATVRPTGAVTGPQLTPEQLQSGQVPQGHPDISGMTGDTGDSGGMGSGEGVTEVPTEELPPSAGGSSETTN